MKVFRVTFISAFLLFCLAAVAFGNELPSAPTGPEVQRLRWKNNTIKVAVSTSLTSQNPNIKMGSDVDGAVHRSLDAWQNVADIEFQIENSDLQSVSPSGTGDSVSLITIAQTPENLLFFSKDADSASAKTRIFYNAKGFITEADIVLNPFQQFSTDGTFGTYDLESTLTHEIGHLLGLHHSGVLGATMLDSFGKNGVFGIRETSPRTLAESDIASIREIYGPNHENVDCCSKISGKLTAETGRAAKNLLVWAEDTETGRVAAEVETAGDGSFRFGALPAGNYSF